MMTPSTEPGTSQKLTLSSWPFSEFEATERGSLCPMSPPVCFLSCVTYHHFRDLHGYDYLVSVGVPPKVTPPASMISANVLMSLQIYVITLTEASKFCTGGSTWGGAPGGFLPGISLDPIDLPENCLNTRVHSQLFPPFPLAPPFWTHCFWTASCFIYQVDVSRNPEWHDLKIHLVNQDSPNCKK